MATKASTKLDDQHQFTHRKPRTRTGKEYRSTARKSSRINRMSRPMMTHLNRRHTMNFMVLHGLVNQRKEVSGRLHCKEMVFTYTTQEGQIFYL